MSTIKRVKSYFYIVEGYKDTRFCKRFTNLLEQLWDELCQTIPFACRFLFNDGVKEEQILAGHFQSTKDRICAIGDEPILILHHTTEISSHCADQ